MSRHFFIVDDAPAVRLMIQDALLQTEARERDITQFEDGQEAIAAYGEHEPDVVFMDLNMPNMDGREATRYILTQNPRARIVVVTGMRPSNEMVRDVLSVGAFEVLHKPVRSGEVQQVLRELNKERPGHGRVI